MNPEALADEIAALPVEGVTILGGEPLDQPEALRSFLIRLKKGSDKGTILFTGHSWNALQDNTNFSQMVPYLDLVIAGPFIKDQAPDSRRWIGSKNQTTHFFSNRYRWLETAWPAPKKEIEIHLRDGEVIMNGTPWDGIGGFLLENRPEILPGDQQQEQ